MKIDYPRHDREGWKRFLPSWKFVLGVFVLMFAAATAVFAIAWMRIDIPEENEVAAAQTSIIYWSGGNRELARLGDTNRISVPLDQIPQDMQHAVVAAEDRRFYQHSGFDVVGFSRALVSNVTTGSTQGGSTITQQYAKNAYLTQDQTYIRKFKELILSLKLELRLSKEEILERYLNTIYFGRGAYGVETAAEAYFRVDSAELTLEQSAALAAIINSPGAFNPDTNMEALQTRYSYVLNGMLDEGYITEEQRTGAEDNFPEFAERSQQQRYGGTNGYLIRAVEREMIELGFTQEELESQGLRIVSTFSRQAQRAAVAAVREQGPTTGMEGVRIGLAAVEPGTGEVRAMYGGADYLEQQLNNATEASQQAGSTFKPFGLAAYTEAGIGLNSYWPGNSGVEIAGFEVNNYGDNSYGSLVSLLLGTEQSINTVYVAAEEEVGVPPVQEAALRAGIPEDTPGLNLDQANLTFVLGTASARTIDIASAYATFAARGLRAETHMVRRVETAGGRVRYENDSQPERTFEQNTADVVNYALQRVVTNGTGTPAQGVGRPVAGKTGTTDEYRSSWFAGYAPQLAAAVSFSKSGPNGEELSLSGTGGLVNFYGSGFPARIWTAFMRGALEGEEVLTFPEPADPPTGGGFPSPEPTPSPSPTIEPSPSEEPSPTAEPSPSDEGSPGGGGQNNPPGQDNNPGRDNPPGQNNAQPPGQNDRPPDDGDGPDTTAQPPASSRPVTTVEPPVGAEQPAA